MANTPKHVDATFYVQVEPTHSHYDSERVIGAKVVRMTKQKPDTPAGGTVLMRLTVRIPVTAFMPLVPEAVIVVPESMTAATPIEVTVEDPNEVQA